MRPDPLRPSALGEQICVAELRALRAATRATERERVWLTSHALRLLQPHTHKISSPPPLQTVALYGKMAKTTSRTNDRGCNHRKVAGEESPGFTGQDAG